MPCYTRILVRYPYMVFLVVFVVIGTCLVLSLTLVEFPKFGNPLDGFEPRGTDIGKRLVTQGNIHENKGNTLTLLPSNFHSLVNVKGKHDDDDDDTTSYSQNETETFVKRSIHSRDYFCSFTSREYSQFAHIAFTTQDNSNLFTAENIRQMCHIEDRFIRTHSSFPDLCLTRNINECCPSWSLGNYISSLSQKSNCSLITEEDVHNVYETLHKCSMYYFNYSLEHDCEAVTKAGRVYSRCKDIPQKCIHLNAVFNVLHLITDVNFLPQSAKEWHKPFLRYAMTFLPVSSSSSNVDLYKHIESWVESDSQNVHIAGIDFGIKYTLFSDYLLQDTIWIIGAISVIFITVWIYTASIFVTIMTFVVIGSSLVVSYFLYQVVFDIRFFPYMNLITTVIVIAIGADDVFVYCKVWHMSKSERNNGTMEKIVSDTIRHATLSMFVTSLTTSAALYSNGASSITAIKCFSIYAGTTILCNFIITITLIPASLIINDKWCHCEGWYTPSDKTISNCLCKLPYKVYHGISNWSRIFFEKLLPFFVVKWRFIWILVFGALGIGGVVVIFVHPKLKLPSSDKFQVFSLNHLIEKYEFQIRNYFWFEKSKDIEELALLPLTFIWGVVATDTGDFFNPANRGSLDFDKTFNAITPSAQTWLLQFCDKLKNADFYQHTPGLQLTNCFFDKFRDYLQKPCLFFDDHPCCNNTYPNSEEISYCLYKYIPMLMNTPGVQYGLRSSGIKYNENKIALFVVEYMSTEHFSYSYTKTKDFYTKVNNWFTQELLSAPPEMKNGWFISDLAMFDLQRSLSEETPVTMGISLGVVAAVIFLTTLNVFISIFALISVACVIFVTIGTLVLMNWELNILEAVIITVALGMSVDYTLHYAVVYRLSPELDRENRIVSCVHSLGSVITMAALTTFLAGAFMMPATVLVYKKFGIFLMLVISISWVYSTIFFLSVLCVMGPLGNFGQFHWPSFGVCTSTSEEHHDKTQYTISESSSSAYQHTTSTATTSTSESRELESMCDDLLDPFPLPQRRRSRSRGQYQEYMKARTKSDSPLRGEGHSRRGSRVRFSIGSIEKTSPSHESEHRRQRRSIAEDSVFEVTEESPSSPVEVVEEFH